MSENQKDLVLKRVFNKNKYFVDIFNNYIFGGDSVIDPESLIDENPELIFDNNKDGLRNRTRDLFKKATYKTDGKIGYLLLGIENQTTIDPNMVLRVMEYDVLSYMRQVDVEKGRKNGKMKLVPVITIVVYYGKGKWTGPSDLYSRIDINDNLKEYISNYKLNILTPALLSDDELKKYMSEIKCLFTYIKYQDDKYKLDEKIVRNNEFERIDNDVVNCINILTDSSLKYDEGEEEINMCKAIKEMREDAKAEGVKEEHERMCKAIKEMREDAKLEGVKEGKLEEKENNIKLMSNNGFDIETIARALSLDISYVMMVLSK